MSKFANSGMRPRVSAPIQSTGTRMPTHNGGNGFEREAKGELFLLGVNNFVKEATFYESANDRDERFVALIKQVTAADPEWMRAFIPWLRSGANMRSASLVAAAEYVKAGGVHGRQLVNAVIQRADEPAEMLAYWYIHHGKGLPKPIKRGIADACARLYTERAVLKYDGQAQEIRFADVIDLVHPSPTDGSQSTLFLYLLDQRRKRDDADKWLPAHSLIAKNQGLNNIEPERRRAVLRNGNLIKDAGWSWERLSGWIPGGMDAEAWEHVIPNMGVMALIRNLRNFDNAGISPEAVRQVIAKITNPDDIKGSRVLPMRFLSAYKSVESERWKGALDEALNLSLQNVPTLKGRTLILLDVSASMHAAMSGKSDLLRWEAAAIFGAALATRAESADLVAYSGYSKRYNGDGLGQLTSKIEFGKGASIFTVVNRVRSSASFGGDTETWHALRSTYQGHKRVVVVTDEQVSASGHYAQSQGSDPGVGIVPLLHTYNIAGYAPAHNEHGAAGRFAFGGLSDASFSMIETLENYRNGVWPWEQKVAAV